MNLSTTTLQKITDKLEQHQINYALGGSGLLYSLGLGNRVGDWDLTTDASLEEVTDALYPLPYNLISCGDYPFGTKFKLLFDTNPEIEIIGGFSIYHEDKLCTLPTIQAFRWKEIYVNSPVVWYVGYMLMGRIVKANLLKTYLINHGADHEAVRILLREPLPDYITKELKGFTIKNQL
ncbi:hypothetical protein [Bacillus sp. AK128]